MKSISALWDDAKDAWNDSTSSKSPGARFGLIGDPLYWIFGDKYGDKIIQSGDWMNERLSGALGTSDRGGWAANKPASTLGLLAAGYFGGGALAGGMGGGAGGGSSGAGSLGTGFGSDLGIFSNGGAAGMQGVGGGNAGLLAANHGIAGGAGMGSAAPTGALGMQDYLKLAQGMGGGQSGQQSQPQPMAAPAPGRNDNSALLIQVARSSRAQALRRKINRTPQENAELRQLTQPGLLG